MCLEYIRSLIPPYITKHVSLTISFILAIIFCRAWFSTFLPLVNLRASLDRAH